jgi:hypothetical protein
MYHLKMGHVFRSFHVLRQTSNSWCKNISNLLLIQTCYPKMRTNTRFRKHLFLNHSASKQQMSHTFPVKKQKKNFTKMRATCSSHISPWVFLTCFAGVVSAVSWIYNKETLNSETVEAAKGLLELNGRKILSKWMTQSRREPFNLVSLKITFPFYSFYLM